MKLPSIIEFDVKGKDVIVRGDLDGDGRVDLLMPTLSKLLDGEAKQILVIGHKGRPKAKDARLSLKPVADILKEKLSVDVGFIDHKSMENFSVLREQFETMSEKVVVLENLRFWEEETINDQKFSEEMASLGDVYVNDSFASSHREHASIVGVPKLVRKNGGGVFLGERFTKEVENLEKLNQPVRPYVVVLSGLKKDKLVYIEEFEKKKVDRILVAGRLPEFLPEQREGNSLMVARLIPDKEDITINSIEKFSGEIQNAKTIVVSGPIGKFEDPGHRMGTERVFGAVSRSTAFKVAGGGDTTQALKILGLTKAFDWVSSGGGAMLDFITRGTLPGIEAIVN